MRRIQLYVDEDLDEALSTQAARLGVSRSSLVRDAVRASLNDHLATHADPVDTLIGCLDIEPDDDIDAVIYGVKE
ncbi:MAG: ribbon-helix-helix domain-containing protein [bacterium]|nr:ribbon-helix-helix domain-containing protein [Acidimicrobiia bacterium]MCY4649888.1 ribbon-helix-helix domain-containing protein [bacterium]